MLYSVYWNNLVNYDQAAVGGYPHEYQFWYVVLPQFMNEVLKRHGKGFFNSTTATIVLSSGDRKVLCPRDLLTIEARGAFIVDGSASRSPYEIIPNDEIPYIGAVVEVSTQGNYPASYRVSIAGPTDFEGPVDGEYKIIILDKPPIAGLSLRLKYIQRPPIPDHPGGVWVDTNLRHYIPDQLLPVLVLLHRAYIFGDREAGNRDSRFEQQMKRFYAALETLDPIMTAGPRGYAMIGSN